MPWMRWSISTPGLHRRPSIATRASTYCSDIEEQAILTMARRNGAPNGKRNGKYRHGGFSCEAINERRRLASLIRTGGGRGGWSRNCGRHRQPHRREVFDRRSKTKGEVRLNDNKTRIFGARCANVTGLGAREPCVDELALQKSVESGNLSLNRAAIRRIW
jgi:hypothetical protein